VIYPEATELGIDDLEYGFFVNTQLDPDKKPDTCSESEGEYTLGHMAPGISTPVRQEIFDAMTPEAREDFTSKDTQ
jgi:hypothetical protein